MGQFNFKLPDVGEGVAEAEIVAWHVAPGQQVAEDAPLVDVMTDKATVEMTSPVAGKVVSIRGEVGSLAAVGSVIAVLEVEASTDAEEAAPVVAAPASTAPARPLASPAVRRRAQEQGVSLQQVSGSGPDGRITQADLEARRGAFGGPVLARRDGVTSVKLVGLRRRIADNMAEAKRRIPHFSYIEEVDVTELEALRAELNRQHGAAQAKLTLLPFLVRALAVVLPRFPQVNATYDDEAGVVHQHAAVHVGIATQTAAGLMVPVLRHAESLNLWRAAAEIGRLAEAARTAKAAREELSGSTITITSLGALGGLATTPVVNRPEVAIVGPNRIVERATVVNGQIVVRRMMNLSSSFDHRVVDGYVAAEFVQALKAALETPALMFVERP